jgi:hypothetical protein
MRYFVFSLSKLAAAFTFARTQYVRQEAADKVRASEQLEEFLIKVLR